MTDNATEPEENARGRATVIEMISWTSRAVEMKCVVTTAVVSMTVV